MAVMTYDRFISTVEQTAHVPSDEAERAACATLRTLSERISAGETQDIVQRLPDQLVRCMETDGPAGFNVHEFVHRVATRTGLEPPAARRDASAVLSALFRTVGPEEFYELRTELPNDFDPLLDEALRTASPLAPGESEPKVGVSLDEFVARVADRADIDREDARRTCDAVLEVLAIRITAGEAEDLAARLPPELRLAMERGIAEAGPAAQRMSADKFLREVTRRLDCSMEEAAVRVRAVMTTLREAVGEKEFHDVVAQLPKDYADLLRYQG